jgi:TonB family protein
MSDAAALPIADLTALDTRPAREASSKEERRFYVGLALAVVLHSLLFVGVYGSPPRNIGDPSGSTDAINVAFISEAELRSLSTTADAPKSQPVPPTPPPPAPTEAAAPPPPPAPSEPAVQPPQQQAAPAPAPQENALPETALTLKPLEAPPLKAEPKPEAKPAAPQKAEPAPPTKQTKPERTRAAKLDLSPPAMFSAPAGSGGAGLERPPGITRSGENDAFARGVVSALRRTMPQLSDATGRVTVRITLDKDGTLVSTQVVRPSNVGGLDRSVVFATRQTSYPFPPRNANAADLVFLITYIYN